MSLVEKVEELPKGYVCRRDDFCAGRLIYLRKPSENIYDGKEMILEQMMQSYGYGDCRKMGFVINDNKTSDVLWSSPNYPISDRMEKIEPEIILVEKYKNLKNVLIYLGYGENLIDKDIREIYRRLFCNNSNFLSDLIEEVINESKKREESQNSSEKVVVLPKNNSSFEDLKFSFDMGILCLSPGCFRTKAENRNNNELPDIETLRFLMNLSVLPGIPSSYESKDIKSKMKRGRLLFWQENQ